jgi:hypothetical protein
MVVAIRSFRSARRCRVCRLEVGTGGAKTAPPLQIPAQYVVDCFAISGAREHLLQDRFPAGVRRERIPLLHHGLLIMRTGEQQDRRRQEQPTSTGCVSRRQCVSCEVADALLAKRVQKPRTRIGAWLHPCIAEFDPMLLHVGSLVNCRWQDDTASFCNASSRTER